MSGIEFEHGAVTIDASLIAEGLGIEPSRVQAAMREGSITSRYERGSDADAGRHRLTFFYAGRRFSLVVDAAGNVIQRSLVDLGEGSPRREGGG